MKFFIVAFLLCAALASAQGIPLIAGGQVEIGSGLLQNKVGNGIMRITPFVGGWIAGLGYGKVGYSYSSSTRTDSSGVEQSLESKDMTLQVGASYGTPDRPYLIGSFTKARQLSEMGDSDWEEWGVGLGAFFHLGGASAILLEVENRWITEHYDPIRLEESSGTRLQMNLGFVVYFL